MKVLDSLASARQWSAACAATLGKYDGMHLGHQRILAALKADAARRELPSLVILSEPHPEEFFAGAAAPPRLNHFRDKVDFLASYGVDAVYRMQFDHALSQQGPEDFVRQFLVAGLGLKSLVIGDDFRFGRNRGGDMPLLQQLGTELDFSVARVAPCIDDGERISSTLVRRYLLDGDCAHVMRLLGRPYSISGIVIRGRQLGRQIGVPTANVELLTPGLPMTGVFVVKATLPGREMHGVANVGFKPTVTSERTPSLEVHLLDFDGDIYGERLQVHFLNKLRNEQKFAGLAGTAGANSTRHRTGARQLRAIDGSADVVNVESGISSTMSTREFRLIWLFLLAAGIIMLDQMTKAFAVSALQYGIPRTVFPGFDLLLAHNYGAAFSFLDDAGGWQRWLLAGIATGASIFICAWLARLPRQQMLLGVALACILGGALGNLYDRVVMGYVVDFISVYYGDARFATFNIADVALNVGAALIVLDVVLGRKAHE